MIKATRLQAWALAGGGARVGRRPPPLENKNIIFLAILGAFLLLFLHIEAFLLRFSHFVGLFATFYFMVEAFLWACPPPSLRKFLRAPMIARRVREHASPEIFWCDRNLVSCGHVLLRFCLKK